FIILVLVSLLMCVPVHLDHQAPFGTAEVENERAEGVLAPDAQPQELPAPQRLPEHSFRRGQIAPHRPRACLDRASGTTNPDCRLKSWFGLHLLLLRCVSPWCKSLPP